MNIRPNRLNRGRPESAQETPSTQCVERPRPATPPLTPEPGCVGYSPLEEAGNRLAAAYGRITELEATCAGLHRLLLSKQRELDDLHKHLEGTALPTPITGPAKSALRAAKKKRKRNRR
jgi:hypothetical protein